MEVSFDIKKLNSNSDGVFSNDPSLAQVKFKELSIYNVLGEILKPSILPIKENSKDFFFFFCRSALQDGNEQVLLRICLFDTMYEQDDDLAGIIVIKVNGSTLPLPEAQRPNIVRKCPYQLLDITSFLKFDQQNHITIMWSSRNDRAYIVAAFLVQKKQFETLIDHIKTKVQDADHTSIVIKKQIFQDQDPIEMSTISYEMSLKCPLTQKKLQLPCRAVTCSHLECFEAAAHINHNRNKSTWICPICSKPALFEELVIDGLFLDMITRTPEDCTKVLFYEDGTWSPFVTLQMKKPNEVSEKGAIEMLEESVIEVFDLEEM